MAFDRDEHLLSTDVDYSKHPQNSKPKIKWFAVWGGQRFPREKQMQGRSWDATCSCGWDSKTGGALESYVKKSVADHRLDHEVIQKWAARQQELKNNPNLGRQFD